MDFGETKRGRWRVARPLRSCPLRHAAVEPGRVGPLLLASTLDAEIAQGSPKDTSHLAVIT